MLAAGDRLLPFSSGERPKEILIILSKNLSTLSTNDIIKSDVKLCF